MSEGLWNSQEMQTDIRLGQFSYSGDDEDMPRANMLTVTYSQNSHLTKLCYKPSRPLLNISGVYFSKKLQLNYGYCGPCGSGLQGSCLLKRYSVLMEDSSSVCRDFWLGECRVKSPVSTKCEVCGGPVAPGQGTEPPIQLP